MVMAVYEFLDFYVLTTLGIGSNSYDNTVESMHVGLQYLHCVSKNSDFNDIIAQLNGKKQTGR